jgi:hypothetical protein
MDVAEAEIEVGVFNYLFPYTIPSLLVGAIQENGWTYKGHVYNL